MVWTVGTMLCYCESAKRECVQLAYSSFSGMEGVWRNNLPIPCRGGCLFIRPRLLLRVFELRTYVEMLFFNYTFTTLRRIGGGSLSFLTDRRPIATSAR